MSILAGNWATDDLIASITTQAQAPYNWNREAFTTALWNSILSHYFPLHGINGYMLYHEDYYRCQIPGAPLGQFWTGWSDMSLAQHYQSRVAGPWQTRAATMLIIECKRVAGGRQDRNNLYRAALEQLTRALHETITNTDWYRNQPLFGAMAIGRLVIFVEATPNPLGGVVNLAPPVINGNQYQQLNLQTVQGRMDAATVLTYIRERYNDWWKNLQNVRFGR